jgi:CheY-like chemotaxis protein
MRPAIAAIYPTVHGRPISAMSTARAVWLMTARWQRLRALALLARGPFGCVLMDLEMPVRDGYTATAHIRANPAWAGPPKTA